MTTNKSLYQAPPHEIEWVEFQYENRYKVIEWVKGHVELDIEEEFDGSIIFSTSDDYGRTGWDVLPFGSLVCRNVTTDHYYIILPKNREEYLERLTLIPIHQ